MTVKAEPRHKEKKWKSIIKQLISELQKRHENQKKKLDLEFGDLDAKRREFEREKEAFDEMYRQWQERSGDKKKKQKASLF